MPIAELLLPEIEEEVQATRTLLERVPDGHWSWKPHEKSMSLSRLATHVAEIASWTAAILEQDEMDFMSPVMQEWAPREMESVSEILNELESAVGKCREIVTATSDEEFRKPWSMKMGDQVLMTAPTYIVFRRQVLNHLVHHRAQLGVFLRMLDVPLPMIYGPTADEEGAMAG
jgi:uncharacterized damage-inducible protein DinB